jgi:transposase
LLELYQNLVQIDEKIERYNKIIEDLFDGNEVCERLEEIPGVGKLSATILASVLGNGSGFKNGRHFAAFLGLTPKEHSSGEKDKLLGISKGGDTYIRTLLIHGARSVLLYSSKKTDVLSMWLKRIKERSGANVAAVALANKMARMALAMVKGNCDYKPNHKPRLQNALIGALPQTPEYLKA